MHTFHQIEEMFLVTPKQEMEQKGEWFCGVNFTLIIKYSEKKIFDKIRFFKHGFCSGAAILLYFD